MQLFSGRKGRVVSIQALDAARQISRRKDFGDSAVRVATAKGELGCADPSVKGKWLGSRTSGSLEAETPESYFSLFLSGSEKGIQRFR